MTRFLFIVALATTLASCSKEPTLCEFPTGGYLCEETQKEIFLWSGGNAKFHNIWQQMWWSRNAQGQLYVRKKSGHDASAFNMEYACDSVLIYEGFEFRHFGFK